MGEVQTEVTGVEAASIDTIRQMIGSILASGAVEEYCSFIDQFGHLPVWIDDPTGHYPLRRQRLGGLKADIGYTVHRLYFVDKPDEPHPSDTEATESKITYTNRRFTLTVSKLGSITRVLSEEDIE